MPGLSCLQYLNQLRLHLLTAFLKLLSSPGLLHIICRRWWLFARAFWFQRQRSLVQHLFDTALCSELLCLPRSYRCASPQRSRHQLNRASTSYFYTLRNGKPVMKYGQGGEQYNRWCAVLTVQTSIYNRYVSNIPQPCCILTAYCLLVTIRALVHL